MGNYLSKQVYYPPILIDVAHDSKRRCLQRNGIGCTP